MDRNLGALDDKYHAAADIKAKYYQFGRKDPFNSDIYCWTYDAITLAPTKTPTANGCMEKKSKTLIDSPDAGGYDTGGHNVPFSVSKPTIHISSDGFWSSATDLFGGEKLEDNKTTKYWNEPRPFIRLENEEISSATENKSIFDPCPLGWRLPVRECFSGFRGDTSGSATGDPNMNFQYGVDNEFKNRGTGRTYIPLGYLSQKGNQNAQTVFYPYSGGRFGNGNLIGVQYYAYYWFGATPCGESNGHSAYFSSGFCFILYSIGRGCSFPVRCIKE